MNPLAWKPRTAFGFAAALSAALLAYAFYSQFAQNLEPCPLCIFQRIALIGVFIVSLVAALHNPALSGRRAYGTLAALAAGAGFAVAARHVWIQHLPPDELPPCGPGLGYMLDTFPISKTLKMAFTGSGECARVDWTLLGLSMPEWNLILFTVLFFGALWYGFRRYGH